MTNRMAGRLAAAIVGLSAVAVLALAVARLTGGAEPHVDIDPARYPVRGIDLSAHNGVPDFDSIAAAGIDFVYLKASEGISFRDPAFMRNYVAARRAGLKVGAYHFFRFDRDGTRQAANFLDAIGGCRLDLPPAIDVEEWGNPAQVATPIIVERLRAMNAVMKGQHGRMVVYTNKNGEARIVRNALASDSVELWICSFTDPPLSRRPWRLWQHSHRGRVAGVEGDVDLNTFNGSRDDWQQWLAQ